MLDRHKRKKKLPPYQNGSVLLNRKSDYALQAVCQIANAPSGTWMSINEISVAANVPREYLAKVLAKLVRARLLVAVLGATGGYRLARRPQQISFLEVIEAVNGPIVLSLCSEKGSCSCRRVGDHYLHEFWRTWSRRLRQALAKEHFGKYVTPIPGRRR